MFMYQMYQPMFCAAIAIAIVFGNISVYANIVEGTNVEKCEKLCSSGDCLTHVQMMLNSIQPNIDPCQDFYSFACSGFMEKYGKETSKTIYDETWYALQIYIKDMLDHLRPAEGSASGKMKSVYDTCMNDGLSELKSVSEALNFLDSIGIQNWPHLDSDIQDPSLNEIMGKLAVYGEFSFVTFKPSPYGEKEHGNSNSLPTVLIMPDNFLLSSKLKPKDIETTVLKVLRYFDIDEDAANIIWQEFRDIENIGIGLQNNEAGNSHRCLDGSTGAFMKVNCSEEVRVSLIYLCNIWKESVKSGNLGKYFLEDSLHLSCGWNQLYYVEHIFSNLTRVSKRSIINYLATRFFIAHLEDLNLYFQGIRVTHSGVQGSKHRANRYLSRWEYCVAFLIKSMNLALGYEYTKNNFKKSYEIDVSHIIRNYVKELKIQIEKQDWIKDRVKAYLNNQIDNVNIGYRNTMRNYRNETLVSSCFSEFKPVNGSFLKSMLELQKTSLTLNEKCKTQFNGFYSSSDPYTMDFGFALFLPPIYSFGLSKLWNYATLGWVIGHELSHNLKLSFDLVYLDEQTESNLNEKTTCYAQQYSEFVIEKIGKMIQSKETEEEIFADNVGWSLTEKILESYLAVTNVSLSLPGYEYTPRQLIYIKFAQACCEVLSQDVENELYSTSPQSVERLRVFGILQNSKMFSEAFNCSAGTFINPTHKCTFFQ